MIKEKEMIQKKLLLLFLIKRRINKLEKLFIFEIVDLGSICKLDRTFQKEFVRVF